jgi:hypothetical protein
VALKLGADNRTVLHDSRGGRMTIQSDNYRAVGLYIRKTEGSKRFSYNPRK